jgi:hypothetical protein
MKLSLACIAALALAPSVARADDDPGMQIMTIMMRSPAISADGKHVAIYSSDGGSEKGANTSLAVFGKSGKLEQRISIVPPAVDVARAKAAVAKIAKLLDAGGYQRMSRVARGSEARQKTTYTTHLTSEDVELDLAIAQRKVTVTATRAGKKLASVTRALPAKDGPCTQTDAFDVANTMAGYDAKTKQLAFSVQVWQGDAGCFGHDFVVTLP